MGQKVNPNGFRVGVIRDWNTRWYASKKEFSDFLIEDKKIRDHIKEVHYAAGIARIDIMRATGKVTVSIYTGRPGMLIGKGGVGVDAIKADVSALIGKPVNVNIMEIKNPDANAQLVAENIAAQLEKRISFRRAMKQSMMRATKAGAKGIKISCGGRLGGAEIARSEGYHEGSIPLQTIRADIEYGFAEARTAYGRIGVKVWIYKGEVLNRVKKAEGGQITMLMPKRVKRRRVHRGRMTGKALRGNTVTYGDWGLMATEPAWVTSQQIEAARVAMTRYIKRGGKVWIKIFPDKPVTEKPAETRMGSGKGSPEYWVAVVKPGRVMFEIAGVDDATAREALRLAMHKLPLKCKFVQKETVAGGESNEG